MKKLVCMLAALMICAVSALAAGEGALTVDPSEISLTLPDNAEVIGKPELSGSAREVTEEDEVKIENGVYEVKLPSGTKLTLDASQMPYVVYTQNYFASLDLYMQIKDPDQLINALKENHIHLLVLDAYGAFDEIQVRAGLYDGLSKHVRNLKMLTKDELAAVANALATNFEVSGYQLHEANDNIWIQLGDNMMLSIANSEYVIVGYLAAEGAAMTENDFADFTDFINVLKVE